MEALLAWVFFIRTAHKLLCRPDANDLYTAPRLPGSVDVIVPSTFVYG